MCCNELPSHVKEVLMNCYFSQGMLKKRSFLREVVKMNTVNSINATTNDKTNLMRVGDDVELSRPPNIF